MLLSKAPYFASEHCTLYTAHFSKCNKSSVIFVQCSAKTKMVRLCDCSSKALCTENVKCMEADMISKHLTSKLTIVFKITRNDLIGFLCSP